MAQGGPAIPGASCPRGAAPVGPVAPGQAALREETITPIKIIVKENFTMKKFLSAVLALAMAFALCTTAFAASSTVYVTTKENGNFGDADGNKSWPIDIPAQYSNTAEAKDVAAKYYVVVEWTVNSDLTYKVDSSNYTWNVTTESSGAPSSAGYTATDGEWTGSASVVVNVANWSNRAMKATLTYKDSTTTVANVTKDITTTNTLDKNELTLAAASDLVTGLSTTPVTALMDAQKGTSNLSITAVTAGAINRSDAVIGTLTVTLAENTATIGG